MSISSFINKIANLGVKSNYLPWEVFLTRKLNLTSLFGAANILIGLLIFIWAGYLDSIYESLFVLLLIPFVFILNVRFSYILAIYLFAFIGCFLFFFLSVKMGSESFAFLYFFPFVLAILQMLGRKETFIHLFILFVFLTLTIFGIISSYYFSWFEVKLSNDLILLSRNINVFISFFTSLLFISIITFEANKQETQLKIALKQKEVLLAELFHRVKNNLNIVTSLLNLKKDAMRSLEAKSAIEECRSMVFSMAMVHTRIYNSNSIDNLNFKEYLEDLSKELINSIGGDDKVEFILKAPLINLHVSQAIPCGLIINEFITNAFKHARISGKKLKIYLDLNELNDLILMELKDNGPGIMLKNHNKGSLGLGLIKSLTEQLDGESSFVNSDGVKLNISFKKQILNTPQP